MGIVEVDMEIGFWFGGVFWSRDVNTGELVTLSKREYDQMIVNGEVIVLEA